MNLKSIKAGDKIVLTSIPDDLVSDLLRLGVSNGDTLVCVSSIPAGPVILQQDLQEIAIGEQLSRQIQCEKI